MTIEEKINKAVSHNNKYEIDKIFREVYDEYVKLVYFIICKYVDNSYDVEELTNDVFISLYPKLFKERINNIKGYIVMISKNKALDFLKFKKNIDILIIEDVNQIVDLDESNETFKDIVNDMKNALDSFEISLILAHLIDDISFKDLSIKYNKPLKTLYSIYKRSIKKYKKYKGEKSNEKK